MGNVKVSRPAVILVSCGQTVFHTGALSLVVYLPFFVQMLILQAIMPLREKLVWPRETAVFQGYPYCTSRFAVDDDMVISLAVHHHQLIS